MPPHMILLLSGKRKSGKDYLTEHLKKRLGDKCHVIKISEPIKSHWAKKKHLNLNELLSDGAYKETYRREMIEWSDEMRLQDYGCFCRQACLTAPIKDIWIVSDIRRKTDIKWFKEEYSNLIKTIRIMSDEETRCERGFRFAPGVDDVTSECDLDDFTEWDLTLDNGKERRPLTEQLECVLSLLAHL